MKIILLFISLTLFSLNIQASKPKPNPNPNHRLSRTITCNTQKNACNGHDGYDQEFYELLQAAKKVGLKDYFSQVQFYCHPLADDKKQPIICKNEYFLCPGNKKNLCFHFDLVSSENLADDVFSGLLYYVKTRTK